MNILYYINIKLKYYIKRIKSNVTTQTSQQTAYENGQAYMQPRAVV